MAEVIAYFNYLEGGICLRINRLSRRVWIRRYFSLISRLGDGGFWVALGFAMYLMQGPKVLPVLVQMAATSAVGIAVYKLLKNRLVRQRPYINHGDILCGTAPLDQYSFPSGHTLHAVSLTLLFWAYAPVLLVIALPFTLLVAASRVILGLHYPSDVLFGAAIGAVLATACLALA